MGNVTLSEVNVFEGCTTSVEVQCTITPGTGTGNNEFRVCFTEFITINRPGVRVVWNNNLDLISGLILGLCSEYELSAGGGNI